MMKFEFIGFCEDLDLLSCGIGEKDVAVRQTEPDPVVEDDISFDEFDVDELERRMWRDKERLKRLKEQTRIKEEPDEGKQRQSSQEQARDKVRLKRLTEQIKAKERTDAVKHRQSQEQARRKKMSRA